jgi:hypothetical protein
MLYNLDIKEHFYKTLIVSFVSCLMMLFVTELVVPIQSYFLPEITLYAALIFPVHGIRVLSAWLFGWASVFYLFVSNIFIFFLLSRHEENIYALLSTQSVIAWVLVSVICIFTFDPFGIPRGGSYRSNGNCGTSGTLDRSDISAIFFLATWLKIPETIPTITRTFPRSR